jgi:hypothetical protein
MQAGLGLMQYLLQSSQLIDFHQQNVVRVGDSKHLPAQVLQPSFQDGSSKGCRVSGLTPLARQPTQLSVSEKARAFQRTASTDKLQQQVCTTLVIARCLDSDQLAAVSHGMAAGDVHVRCACSRLCHQDKRTSCHRSRCTLNCCCVLGNARVDAIAKTGLLIPANYFLNKGKRRRQLV